jgi:hypothetical protein
MTLKTSLRIVACKQFNGIGKCKIAIDTKCPYLPQSRGNRCPNFVSERFKTVKKYVTPKHRKLGYNQRAFGVVTPGTIKEWLQE